MTSFTPEQADALRRFAGVPADADADTILAGLTEAVAEYREELGDEEWQRRIDDAVARHRTSSAAPPPVVVNAGFLGPDAVCDSHDIDEVLAWGVGTGRFTPVRAEWWRGEAAAEKARTGSILATEAAVRALRPLYYEIDQLSAALGAEASAESDPDVDEYAHLFPPTPEDRERAEVLATEAEAEYRHLFPRGDR